MNEFSKTMNYLDIIIAVPLGYLVFKGFRRGLIFELASLAGIVLGCFVAVRMANWFSLLVGLQGNNAFLIAFFILFIGVVILALFVGKLVERFVKLIHVGFMNNLAGALLGMLKGVCIVGVLLYYTTVIDLKEKILTCDTKQSSMLYQPVVKSGSQLVGKMDEFLQERKKEVGC